MFSWFDADPAKEFGLTMARLYMERMPLAAKLTEKQFANKSRQTMEKMDGKATEFKQHHSLNTYKVAQMGNTFKWALLDAGYDNAYVDGLTQWLVARLR